MKKILFISISALIIIGTAVFVVYKSRSTSSGLNTTTNSTPEGVVSITPPVIPFCFAKNLTPVVESEGAAGSTYLKLRMKNTTETTCKVQADGVIEILVADHPKNVAQETKVLIDQEVLLLKPQGEVFAQLRFPNGAQCTEPIAKTLKINYAVSPDGKVNFTSNPSQAPTIQVCSNEKEMTTIDIWPWSDQPISQ